jgi:hypothetical protein
MPDPIPRIIALTGGSFVGNLAGEALIALMA